MALDQQETALFQVEAQQEATLANRIAVLEQIVTQLQETVRNLSQRPPDHDHPDFDRR